MMHHVSWRLKSPANSLLDQQLVLANNKESKIYVVFGFPWGRYSPGIPYKVPVIHNACTCDAFFLGRFRMSKTMFSQWCNCLIFLLLPLVKWTRGLSAFQSKVMPYHNILVKGSIFLKSLRHFEPTCYFWETNAWLCQERFPIFKRCQSDDD